MADNKSDYFRYKRIKNIEIKQAITYYLQLNYEGEDTHHYYRCDEDGENFQESFAEEYRFVSDEEEIYLRELFKKCIE